MDTYVLQEGDMMERDRLLAAYLQSGFRLRLAFRLLDEIEKYQQGKPGLWQENAITIEKVAKGILSGELTRYNLDDEYVAKQYGIGEGLESYLFCDLAFYLAGCEATKNEERTSLKYLEWIEENMGLGFYIGFNPRKEVLLGLVKSIEGNALEIASRSRDMESRGRSLKGFCEELEKETNEDAIIGRINLFNDGSYVDLSQDIRALSYILSRREYWNEFYLLLDYLRYFPLQGNLVKRLRNTADVFAIITQATVNQGRKSVHYLLREQFYRIISEEAGVLKGNLNNKCLSSDDQESIQHHLYVFEKEKAARIEAVVDIWLRVFGKEELTTWLSRKRAEVERNNEKYGKQELEIVEMMEKEFTVTSEDINSFQLEDKDFSTLVTLASKADGEAVCGALIKALVKNIFDDHSYPATQINDIWLVQVRTIYRCLSKTKLDGLALLSEVRKPLEGFKVNLDASMRCAHQEAYWLAMLLLSLEESEDEGLFRQYIDKLFMDTRYSINSLTDDVFTPYYVAELLVTQVMHGLKDEYELRLLKDIPYLIFVIRVLTGNQGVMSKDVKALLRERIKRDWELERKLLSQNKMAKMDFYEKFVEEYI